MDNTAVFYTVNMGSIPVGRTNKYATGFGEMDIISVFETDGVGSIPTSPATYLPNCIRMHYTHFSSL